MTSRAPAGPGAEPRARADHRAGGPASADELPARSVPVGGAATAPAPGSAPTSTGAPEAAPPRVRPAGEQSAPPDDLHDEAAARGVDYRNRSGEAHKPTILEANGAGVALLDLGGDGDLDLVFGQGLASLGAVLRGPGADLEVFENQGDGRFRRVPGPGLSGWWTGLATGDLDDDGDPDLVTGGYGELVVLLQKDGRLVPQRSLMPDDPGARLVIGAPRERGLPPLWVTSLALFDADRDGKLDLYVGQYLDLDPVAPPVGELGSGPLSVPCRWKGLPVYCGPAGLRAQPDRLLRGLGGPEFEDVSARWLPGHVAGYTLGVLAFDADGDGDTDVMVANDSSPNLLLINDGGLAGTCTLTDRAYAAGVALSADGRAQAGMGLAAGDVDRDGRLDLAVTNFSDEPTELYFGAKIGFTRMTHRLGLWRETRSLLSWGVHLSDFDGDGKLELFTANGHVYPQADQELSGTAYGQAATLWRFERDGVRRVGPSGPTSILSPAIGARGSAVGDLDLDGDLDLVLVRIDAPAALGINRMGAANHRLSLRLLGPERTEKDDAKQEDASGAKPPEARGASARRTPLDGHGARAIVVVGRGEAEHALLGEVQTAAGFQSASSPWLDFGLGLEPSFQALRILWPSGRVEELPGGAADRRIVIREGLGIVSSERFR